MVLLVSTSGSVSYAAAISLSWVNCSLSISLGMASVGVRRPRIFAAHSFQGARPCPVTGGELRIKRVGLRAVGEGIAEGDGAPHRVPVQHHRHRIVTQHRHLFADGGKEDVPGCDVSAPASGPPMPLEVERANEQARFSQEGGGPVVAAGVLADTVHYQHRPPRIALRASRPEPTGTNPT